MTKVISRRTIGEQFEPLVVSPRQACLLLGVGSTRLYQLISRGEVVAYKDGRATRITMQSIRARVERLAAAASANDATQEAPPRRSGRPRKQSHEAHLER